MNAEPRHRISFDHVVDDVVSTASVHYVVDDVAPHQALVPRTSSVTGRPDASHMTTAS